MKKLFTSLLLLGTVAVSQAQQGQEPNPLSITSFDNGVLTVNYNERIGSVKEKNVNDVLNDWAEVQFPDLHGPARDAAVKDAVQTLKLTGAWSNTELKKDNKTIFNLIEKCEKPQEGVGLDLSACNSMQCEYLSVTETYDDINNNGEITFSYTPTGSTQTIQNSVEIVPNAFLTMWGNAWLPTDELPQGLKDSGATECVQEGDKWYVCFSNGGRQEASLVDGYRYQDQYGDWIFTPYRYQPYNLTEVRDQNGQLTGYVYQYTVTSEGFSFEGYEHMLSSVVFPNHDKFTFIPDKLMQGKSTLKSVTLPASLRAIGNHAFASATGLNSVNFPDNLEEIGGGAFENTRISGVDLRNTKVTVIRWCTFMKNPALEYFYFPDALTLIEYNAFLEDRSLGAVDLSNCHKLRLISTGAFGDCYDQNNLTGINSVKICSHPKILRGNGHGNGCFNGDMLIKTVEITACYTPDDPITDITKCYCEIGAFSYDITEVQTQLDNVSKGARLIFPDDMPVGENQVYAGTTHQSGTYVDDQGVERQTFGIEQGTAYTNPYTSAFDFFVGDYKSGVLLSQTNLQVFFNNVPNNLDVAPGYGSPVNQPDLGEYVPGVSADENHKVVGDTRYAYNGWMEFVNVEKSQIVQKGEFLRTYSRTAGDGPCLLPKGITAYRAVDYKSNAVGWVLDRNRKTGTHYLKADASSDLTDDSNYVLITEETDPADYANRPLYSKVTTGGKLFLRPLVAKVAQYDGHEGYEGDNIDYFDSEEVYSQLTNVPGGYSYVPEETGVVLYSSNIDEKSFLVLGGDFGTETVYKKFPHTGDRYEEGRLSSSNTDDDINMLQGSFGDGVPVAPVFPWVYKDKTNYTGGSYTKNKEYRNFAAVKIERNGGSVVEDRYRWKRLTPSKMKINRAFASIPVNRFDNWNESVDQMPDFTIEDEVLTDGNNNSNLMLISVFGDEEVNGETDGIEEIKTTDIIVVNANDNVWYTTQGVRVANPSKGVYIHNGKKVVIK